MKKKRKTLAVSAAGILFALCIFALQSKADALNGIKQVTTDKDLIIPIAEITTDASFYPVDIEGTRLEVIAVKAPDGSIRTAFNTCQVCYGSGRGYYKQQGNFLICQNCGNRFRMNQVETRSGGCNPIPIFADNKKIVGKNIVISKEFLKKSKNIFANWNRS
ncbi:MAG: DUF2318 domain-containing protein [Elusimicrobiota bacterium]|jgi:uncharacterized membrane protein|nr:DUF2318 domain-containing protein [Elusimicrobiota bacterium]